jgi:hypothetical protein
MIVDRAALTELATRLKLTSDRAASARRDLSRVAHTETAGVDIGWADAMADITSIDQEIAVMQRILNALWLRSIARTRRIR